MTGKRTGISAARTAPAHCASQRGKGKSASRAPCAERNLSRKRKNGSEILKKALEMISRAFLYFKILESVPIGIDKRKEKKYDFKCE